jgi:glycosyltransferase involved in cell wall biosynthesis
MRRFGAIIRLFLRNIPVIVASGYLLNIFKKYKLNVSLIPYHFHYEDFPKRERSFSWNKKFIWAGQFQSMYDPETALKACEVVLKQRDDVEFDFFGDGPLLNGLKKRYSGPKIKFNGFIPRNDLLREYQQYCIFLNTSFGDNFPLRLVEAAFYELLVISSRSSGTATIYNDKECLFFEKGDYRKLSEYILNVMEKPHLYDSLRENIHRKIMSFTWDSVKGDWLKLLKG